MSNAKRVEDAWQRDIGGAIANRVDLRLAAGDPTRLAGMRALYMAGALSVYQMLVEVPTLTGLQELAEDLRAEFEAEIKANTVTLAGMVRDEGLS